MALAHQNHCDMTGLFSREVNSHIPQSYPQVSVDRPMFAMDALPRNKVKIDQGLLFKPNLAKYTLF
jgi:hypothetical protein